MTISSGLKPPRGLMYWVNKKQNIKQPAKLPNNFQYSGRLPKEKTNLFCMTTPDLTDNIHEHLRGRGVEAAVACDNTDFDSFTR